MKTIAELAAEMDRKSLEQKAVAAQTKELDIKLVAASAGMTWQSAAAMLRANDPMSQPWDGRAEFKSALQS
jgi:hypothetical protein